MMGRSIEPLAVGKVIGDVVDWFVTEAKLTVQFGSKQVGNGCEIKPSMVSDRPFVRVHTTASHNATNLYTLVCSQPMLIYLFIFNYNIK